MSIIALSRSHILKKLDSNEKKLFHELVAHLKKKDTEVAKKQWKKFLENKSSELKQADVNQIMFLALRQSFIETSKDTAYWANKIREHNERSKSTRENLKNLRKKLEECNQGSTCDEKNKSALDRIIKDTQAQQEELRNKRTLASTAFQNFDQKTNQLFNILSSLLKELDKISKSYYSGL